MEIYFPIERKNSNFSPIFNRSSKPEKNDELQHVERQVEKYRDVLQVLSKKVSPPISVSGQDPVAREKRMKKTHEFLLGQAMDESAKELPDGLFKKILDYCGEQKMSIRNDESRGWFGCCVTSDNKMFLKLNF